MGKTSQKSSKLRRQGLEEHNGCGTVSIKTKMKKRKDLNSRPKPTKELKILNAEDTPISSSTQHICNYEKSSNDTSATCKGNTQYCCGACCQKFPTICLLHCHLLGNHQTGGSYHYNNYIQTAFPKYETCCRFTQTDDLSEQFGRMEHDLIPETSESKTGNTYVDVSGEMENEDKLGTEDKCVPVLVIDCSSKGSESCRHSDDISGKPVSNSDDDADAAMDSDVYTEMEAEEELPVVKGACVQLQPKSSTKPLASNLILKLDPSKSRGTKQKKTSTNRTKRNEIKKANIQSEHNTNLAGPAVKIEEATGVKVEDDSAVKAKGLECELCGSVFSFKRGLIRHQQRKHKDILKYSCAHCDNRYLRQENLQMHIKCVHISVNKTNKTKELKLNEDLQMKVVEDATKADAVNVSPKKGLKREKEELEDQKAPHTCEICGYTMPKSKMDVHKRLHSGERPFVCSLCGKGLISHNKLKRHMLIHSEVKKHTCEVCGVGFQMKYKLRMHMHIHTGKKPYLCSICGAEFNNGSNLATHTRCVHLQIKPFVCSTCGGCYAKRSQLDDHILSHSNEKQYTCRYCGKSFKYFKGMRRHEKNHSEEKGYKCAQCSMWFSTQEKLEHHQANHDSIPHCQICKRSFPDIKALKVHEASVCKKKRYSCSICRETYKACNQYYTHMLAAHNIDHERAKQLHYEDLNHKKTSTSNSTADPNQPLQIDAAAGSKDSSVSKEPRPVLNSFQVSQVVSGFLGDNQLSINAMTRVATENLRLHSEDIDKDEPITSLQTVAQSLTESQILTAVRNVSCSIGGEKQVATSEPSSKPEFQMGPMYKGALKFPQVIPLESKGHLTQHHVQQQQQQHQQQQVAHGSLPGIIRPIVMTQSLPSNYAQQSVTSNALNVYSGPRPIQDIIMFNTAHVQHGDQSILHQQQQQALDPSQALGTLALVASSESSLLEREGGSTGDGQNQNLAYRLQNLY